MLLAANLWFTGDDSTVAIIHVPSRVVCVTAGALGTAKGCPWHTYLWQPGCLAGVISGGMKLVITVYLHYWSRLDEPDRTR